MFLGPNEGISLREIPLVSPGDGELLVRVECCTICGSDLHSYAGRRKVEVPSVLGHEAVGRIEGIGKSVCQDLNGHTLAVGDRVIWSIVVACGECDRCQRGIPQKCRRLFKYGHQSAAGAGRLSGGLSQHMMLRKGTQTVRVSKDTPASRWAPVSCAWATAAAALRRAGDVAGQRVLVTGAGMVGIAAAAMARQDAALVVVVDRSVDRLHLASLFGADETVVWDRRNAPTTALDQHRFDVVIECTGVTEITNELLNFCDVSARIVLVGAVAPTAALNWSPEAIVRGLLQISGMHNYQPSDLLRASEFVTNFDDASKLDNLVAESYTLDRVQEAFSAAAKGTSLRIAVCT